MHGLKCGLSYRCVAGMDQYSVFQQLITLGRTVSYIVHVDALAVCARTSFEPISSPTLD